MQLLEQRDRPLGLVERLVEPALGLGRDPREDLLDKGMRLQAGIAGGLDEHLTQDLVGRLELAYLGERLAKSDRQVEPDGVAPREPLGGPGEDVDTGRHTAAEDGTVTGAGKPLHRPP